MPALSELDESAWPRVNVLGVGITVLNLPLAVERICHAVSARRKGYVCVTGVHGVMEAQYDLGLRRILNAAFLNTPDGMPMVWCGKMAGHRGMSRVYGPDLMLELAAVSVERGLRHFFYGGANGAAEELKRRLTARFPGLQVVGTYEPPFRPLNPAEESQLSTQVSLSQADILWVGLSTPKQEKFMAAYQGKLDVPIMIAVGAAFDFHSGRVKQAPRWIQRSGFEWLYRLSRDPKRLWKRYFKNNPRFLFRIACQSLGLRKYPLD